MGKVVGHNFLWGTKKKFEYTEGLTLNKGLDEICLAPFGVKREIRRKAAEKEKINDNAGLLIYNDLTAKIII